MSEYTRDQVAEHSAPDDCWVILDGDVLDLSNFGAQHPGKDAHLYGAGKDVSELMRNIRIGAGHPDRAFQWAQSFKIGTLKK